MSSTYSHRWVSVLAWVLLGCSLRAQDGALDSTFSSVSGPAFFPFVSDLVQQPNGKWLVFGYFDSWNGVPCPSIIRLDANEQVDPSFTPPAGKTLPYFYSGACIRSAVVKTNGQILIGGSFWLTVNGTGDYRMGLALLEANGTFVPANWRWKTIIGGSVQSVVLLDNGRIVVGGTGLSVSGETGSFYVAAFSPDGYPDHGFAWRRSTAGSVRKMALIPASDPEPEKIVVYGVLPAADGSHVDAALTLDANGAEISSWSLPNGSVADSAVQPDGKQVWIGAFTQLGTVAQPRIGRLQTGGQVDPSFLVGNGPNGAVNSLFSEADGRLVVAGDFTAFNGIRCGGLIRLQTNGVVDGSYGTVNGGAAGAVFKVRPLGNTTVVCGAFRTVNGSPRAGLACLDRQGALATNWIGHAELKSAGQWIRVVRGLSDGKLLVAGSFDGLRDQYLPGIARLLATGSVDPSFQPLTGLGSSVSALAIQTDGKIVVSGWFPQANQGYGLSLARLNTDGSVDDAFHPQFSRADGSAGNIGAILGSADGKLLIGGIFTQVNGMARTNLARLLSDGSLDASFDPKLQGLNSTNSMVPQTLCLQPDGKILVGGYTTFTGYGRGFLARLLTDGQVDAGFQPVSPLPQVALTAASSINGILVQPDGGMVICGDISSTYESIWNRTPRGGLVRYTATGLLDPNFYPSANQEVTAMSPQSDGRILIGGRFTTLDFPLRSDLPYAQKRLARLNADGTYDASLSIGTGLDADVTALTWMPQGKAIVAGRFTNYNGTTVPQLVSIRASSSNAVAAPLISQQPASVTTSPGSNATFTVIATGAGPLTYQWRKDAANIIGATNATVTLTNVQTADAGNYDVVVSNPTGSVTSAAAALNVTATVNKPPVVTLTSPASGAVFLAPATVNFQASASDPDGTVAKVEFFRGATQLGEAAVEPYLFSWTNVGPGTYSLTAKATDNQGASAVSPVVTVVVSLSAPGAVTINKDTKIVASNTSFDGADLTVDHCTATISGPHAFRTLKLINQAKITHPACGTTNTYSLEVTVTGPLVIEAGSQIDGSGKGYLAGRSQGNSTQGGATGAAGGSHGGLGAGDGANAVYGDFRDPHEPGAGGGTGWGYAGPGGGLVRITAASATINGAILANGAAGGSGDYPGGSGGGIRLKVGTLSGTGTIAVDGGDSTWPSASGGGGRVAIYYDTNNGFDLTNRVTAHAAKGVAGPGAVGSVYLKQTGQAELLLIANHGTACGVATPLGTAADSVFGVERLVLSGSNVVVRPDHQLPIQVVELVVQNGALLRHRSTTETEEFSLLLNIASNLVIDATSSIDVSGRGYTQGRSKGNLTKGGATGGAGGSYGGLGSGDGANAVYGDFRDPNEPGSGGGTGWNYAGPGGGLVRITAASATINGCILANGASGGSGGYPGGSGGGIRLSVGTLAGAGTIAVNGGDSTWGSAGSGGGGRVAIYYDTNNGFDLTNRVTAHAGKNGVGPGAVGSVYLKPSGRADLLLIANHGTLSGMATPLGVSTDSVFKVDKVVLSGSNVVARPDHQMPVQVVDLMLQNGALLRHRSTTETEEFSLLLNVASNLVIDARSTIDVSGRGYLPNQTIGNTNLGAATGWSGGSYGGRGYDYNGQSGRVYGDYRNPNEPGSGGGGGGGPGSPGGGLVRIVAGFAQVDGAILANGGQDGNYGEGSGGGNLAECGESGRPGNDRGQRRQRPR